jgi:8-oxo-dGTP pyrophosphatase MutT (NUDIX family)
MALPGGRRESADADLLSTAIRETQEELGFELLRDNLVGNLDDVVPRTPVLPPIAVRPFVFLVPGRLPLSLSSEVAAAQWVQLDDLQEPERQQLVTLEVAGTTRQVQAFLMGNAVVWGMTERIITSLLQHLRD